MLQNAHMCLELSTAYISKPTVAIENIHDVVRSASEPLINEKWSASKGCHDLCGVDPKFAGSAAATLKEAFDVREPVGFGCNLGAIAD